MARSFDHGGYDHDRDPGDRGTHDGVLRIDCDECRMQFTHACDDCVVTFVCSRPDQGAVVLDVEEARAVRAMAEVGLVPVLRLDHRAG